jgi:DNA-binding HxlR family transcriptional regulator
VISDGVKRYSELQKQIPDVTKKMLTQTLRTLEHDGLVERTVYPVIPPKTEYRLTPLGLRFLEPIAALAEWAKSHQKDLKPIFERRNRQRGDAKPSPSKGNANVG